MKQTALILIFTTGFAACFGQATVAPHVVAAAGKHAEAGPIQLSYTVGELSAITTVGDLEEKHVTQGFHQPGPGPVNVTIVNPASFQVSVYPNPAYQLLTVSMAAPSASTGEFIIVDMKGSIIKTQPWKTGITHTLTDYRIDVSAMASGNYTLLVNFAPAYSPTPITTAKTISINH